MIKHNLERKAFKIDGILFNILGFSRSTPNQEQLKAVKIHKNKVVVIFTEPYRRASHHKSWEEVSKNWLHKFSELEKKKLGKAIGSAIASDFEISFERILLPSH